MYFLRSCTNCHTCGSWIGFQEECVKMKYRNIKAMIGIIYTIRLVDSTYVWRCCWDNGAELQFNLTRSTAFCHNEWHQLLLTPTQSTRRWINEIFLILISFLWFDLMLRANVVAHSTSSLASHTIFSWQKWNKMTYLTEKDICYPQFFWRWSH